MVEKRRRRSKVLQMLGSWAPQMGVSKYRSRKKERTKKGSSMCDQATKGIAKEKTSISHMGKGTGVL